MRLARDLVYIGEFWDDKTTEEELSRNRKTRHGGLPLKMNFYISLPSFASYYELTETSRPPLAAQEKP
jgi:hypothetical protein